MGRDYQSAPLGILILILLATTDHVGCIKLLEVHPGGTTWAEANHVCKYIGGKLLESEYSLISKLSKITDVFVSDEIWTPYFTVTGVPGIIDSQTCSSASAALPDVTYRGDDPQQCLVVSLNNGSLATASSCQQSASFVCESDCLIQVKTFDAVYIIPYMVEVLFGNTAAEFPCKQLCLSDSTCITFVFTEDACHFFDVDVETDPRDERVELLSQEGSVLGKKVCATDISLTTSNSKRWNGPAVQHEVDNVELNGCLELCAWMNIACGCADYSNSLRTCILELGCNAQSTDTVMVAVRKQGTIPGLIVVADVVQYSGTPTALNELCPQYFTTSSHLPSPSTASIISVIATAHSTASSDIVSHVATVDTTYASDIQSYTVAVDTESTSDTVPIDSTMSSVSSLSPIAIQSTAENDNVPLTNIITSTKTTHNSVLYSDPASLASIAYSTIARDASSIVQGSDVTSLLTSLSDIANQLSTTTVNTFPAEDADISKEMTTMYASTDVLADMSMSIIADEQPILPASPKSVNTATLIDINDRSRYECTHDLRQLNSSPQVTSFQCISVAGYKGLETAQGKYDQFMSNIMDRLRMDKSETGRSRRKFISVTDDRPSATTVGSIGVLLLSLVFGGIILLDLSTLRRDLHILYQNLRGLRLYYARCSK